MTDLALNLSSEPALARGLKAVGIGKKGSRSLSSETATEILHELQAGRYTQARLGAFFAALWIKGLSAQEEILTQFFPAGTFQNAENLAAALCIEAPKDIQIICGQLLSQKELNSPDAYRLGQFLMSSEKGDGARAVAAIALRVRYETINEYLSLLKVLNEGIAPSFRGPVPLGEDIIQLAEPFDGVDHNYMITPCVAEILQQKSFRVIHLIGRNSGPKFVNNLYDLVKKLDFKFLKNNSDLKSKQESGFYIDQKDLSPILERWVDLRHEIIKRPFLATLEKFLDPCKTDIIVTSAFHGVYGEKMADIAEGAGFAGSIVVRNGVEGTIAFPLTRPAKLLCSARQKDGTYLRKEIIFDATQFFKEELPFEEKLENPSLDVNAKLIKEFLQKGKTNNLEFDRRILSTSTGIMNGVSWIKENVAKKSDFS